MTNTVIDVDQVLKSLASQSIKQGSNVRATVRDLTLKALQQRELTLDQIRKVLRSITEGVNLGVDKREMKVEKALSDTVAGMDDALLKAVQASNVALHRLTGEGYDYEDSNLKQALDELERLEDEFLRSIAKATDSASEKIKAPWDRVLKTDEAVRHRHGHPGGIDHARLRKTGTGGNACAARDELQDGASAHAELRHPGERHTDRNVRGVGGQARRVDRQNEDGEGPQDHEGRQERTAKSAKSAKRATAKTAKRPKPAKRAKKTAIRKSK